VIRHLLSINDLNARAIEAFLDLTATCKRRNTTLTRSLSGKAVALIFEKSSTRTRLACEVACARLGARAVTIAGTDLQIGRGETLADSARVFSRFVDAVCWRTTGHDRLEEFSAAASIPVINTLSDLEHPTQILSDLFTMRQHFKTKRWPSVAFIGDGSNNMSHSWLLAAGKLGMDFRLASPAGYPADPAIRARAERDARASGGKLVFTADPFVAARGVDVLYTDVWVSMGQEAGKAERLRQFRRFQINGKLLAAASPRAVVMHCLPAHRDEEITADMMESGRAIVWDQAGNRLYNAMAALLWCMKGGRP
jgi:ornithine carbamoyltransferase